MNDEIKVGEYIRTNNDHIAKIKRIELDEIDKLLKWYVYDEKEFEMNVIKEKYINKPYIKNHKFNIMDLIESKDMCTIEYYVRKYGKRITRRFEVYKLNNILNFENAHFNFNYDLETKKWLGGKGYNPVIKGIITKEMFKSVEYEV